MEGTAGDGVLSAGVRLRSDTCILSSPDETLIAAGADEVWSTPLGAGLAERVAVSLGTDSDADAIAVGAVPFRADAPAHLVRPREVERIPRRWGPASPVPPLHGGTRSWTVEPEPARVEYERGVVRALAMMAGGEGTPHVLRKVVLARSLRLWSELPVEPADLVAGLHSDEGVTVFAVPLPSDQNGQLRTLVGATPELLLEKIGPRIVSEPLAGSVRRRRDPRADGDAAAMLLRSQKDRSEHAAVVEWIADRLAPHCRRLTLPRQPSPISTSTMWHLATRIEGELRDPAEPSLQLVSDLHPTPAVCGLPCDRALALIAELEPFDRGFFAGAVGWCDDRGDGRWLVTIRCAELAGRTMRLFAGAGIVPGSDPRKEAAETSAKFAAILRAFDIDEEGRPLPEDER